MRRLLSLVAAVLVAVAVGAVTVRVITGAGRQPVARSQCVVGEHYRFTTAQAANAATIAAVGRSRSLPARAVVIALATSLQESRLRNLNYGDRDSLGLFQQRPSQGWGSPNQLRDPRYAAGKFYDALVKVPHWDTMPLTRAAQAVQQSGFPDEYAKWEPRASALTGALLGTVPAGLRCQFPEPSPPSDAPNHPGGTVQVLTALRLDYADARSVGGHGRDLAVAPASWATATWLVANAERLTVESVSFGGRTWRRATGEKGWVTDRHARPDRVSITIAGAQ